MNFERLDNFTVRSDKGFELQREDRFYYHYREGDHALKIDVDPGVNFLEVYIDRQIGWLPPHSGEPISAAKRDEIVSDVSAALSFMGYEHRFRE